jgi:predicted component of type VI protein secretion system
MIHLILDPGGDHQPIKVQPNFPITIGRDPTCEIVLPGDEFVSRLHCTVSCDGRHGLVQDEGSANGTFVNGDKVGLRVLHPDDVLAVGETQYQVSYQTQRVEASACSRCQATIETMKPQLIDGQLVSSRMVDGKRLCHRCADSAAAPTESRDTGLYRALTARKPPNRRR